MSAYEPKHLHKSEPKFSSEHHRDVFSRALDELLISPLTIRELNDVLELLRIELSARYAEAKLASRTPI